MTRTHVSLFAGIGAMDVAAEHAGYTTTHAVELDPFCRSILARRFPDAVLHDDVRAVGARELGTGMDLLSGGFTCQDLSSAGKGAGLEGGLWFEYLRIIRECRPRRVLIENVAVLTSRGLDIVVAGLALAGYGCWWDCVPALAVGAPHLRDRIWITAAPFESMPLEGIGTAVSVLPRGGQMPRAGVVRRWHAYTLEPQATQRVLAHALGAAKREDGVTWLAALDSPLFPTPSASSYGSNRGGAAGRIGPVRHSLSSMARSGAWPTAHPRTHTPRAVHHGRQLANEVAAEESRLWPPSARTAAQGPGRSPHRHGGPNLRTAVADAKPGPLNPAWVEWLMGLPVGWTDPDCAEPVQYDWRSEHGIPRVLADVPHRKQRLMACGNALVWQVALTRLQEHAQ